MLVEEVDPEHISTPYAQQGVSRWDGEYRLWRCCHCDGLAYRSHRERRAAEETSAHLLRHGPLARERLLREAGDAYEIGFRQWLHYHCGVYLGHGRTMSDEDLRVLGSVSPIKDARNASIRAHYEMDKAGARQLLRSMVVIDSLELDALLEEVEPVAKPADDADEAQKEAYEKYADQRLALKAFGLYYLYDHKRYARFTPQDVEAIHRRLFVSEADVARFRALDRDYMPIPDPADPRLVREVSWDVMQQLSPLCQRCDESLMVNVPGLAVRDSPGVLRFWHYSCYNLIAENLAERERQLMYSAFPQPERWRLDRIANALQRLPLLEFEEWKVAETGDYESFLLVWEQRLQLRKDI